MTHLYRIFDINTIVASIGLIMASMSFMTGLQTIKKDRSSAMIMVKMHRFDGYITCLIYIAVAVLSLIYGGIRFWTVTGWAAGLGLIILKILVVRNRKYTKYASRVGMLLFLSWLFIIYQHIT